MAFLIMVSLPKFSKWQTHLKVFLELIHNPNFKEVDQWQVQKQASIQTFANVHVYSELTDQQLKDSMLIPTSNIEHTIQELEHRYGRKLTIGVMPQGPLTIPYVEDKE